MITCTDTVIVAQVWSNIGCNGLPIYSGAVQAATGTTTSTNACIIMRSTVLQDASIRVRCEESHAVSTKRSTSAYQTILLTLLLAGLIALLQQSL